MRVSIEDPQSFVVTVKPIDSKLQQVYDADHYIEIHKAPESFAWFVWPDSNIEVQKFDQFDLSEEGWEN